MSDETPETPNEAPDLEIKTKAFVLLSGGIDSTTCLFIAREQFDEVEAVSINYGQRHIKEREFAARTCMTLNIPITLINIPPEVLGGRGVMLTDLNVEIPDISYDEIQGVSPTYVPFRNGSLLSLVTAHSQKWVMQQIDDVYKNLPPEFLVEGSTENENRQAILNMHQGSIGIFFGAHSEDALNWAYPDCTPEFIGAMANAIYIGTYYTARLHTPLMWMKKHEIIQCGEGLGVDWSTTWSCYAGEEDHCGTCPTCRARHKAFYDAGVFDPTMYGGHPKPRLEDYPPEPPQAA